MQKARSSTLRLSGVIVLLILQVTLFYISLNTFTKISVFCTATTIRALELFGYIHLAYIALFMFGLSSLFWKRGRLVYLLGIGIMLLALPIQVRLVANETLFCDGP